MSVKQIASVALVISVTFVLMLYTAFSGWRTPGTLQEELFRVELALADDCPLRSDYLDKFPIDVTAVCVAYGKRHAGIVEDWPSAVALYEDYGNLPEWLEVADKHGLHAVQVVEKFRRDGSHLFAAQHQLGSAVQSLWQGEVPTWQTELEPIQYGYLAIMAIHKDDHDFLSQFAYDEEGAQLRLLTGMLRTTESVLISGVTDLQDKLVLGQKTGYADWGWAAADGAVLFLGGSAFLKGIKGGAKSTVVGGKGAASTSKLAGLKAVSAKAGGLTLKGTAWTAKKAAPLALSVGVAYVVFKHPQAVVATLASWGLPTGWAITLFLVVATVLLWPLVMLVMMPLKALHLLWRLLRWPFARLAN